MSLQYSACTYVEFLFVEKMQCGHKEIHLLRTFSCGYLGLLRISRVNCTYVRTYVIYSTFVLVCIIGASVSEPLINVVNVRRVCMYVCVVRHSVNI